MQPRLNEILDGEHCGRIEALQIVQDTLANLIVERRDRLFRIDFAAGELSSAGETAPPSRAIIDALQKSRIQKFLCLFLLTPDQHFFCHRQAHFAYTQSKRIFQQIMWMDSLLFTKLTLAPPSAVIPVGDGVQ